MSMPLKKKCNATVSDEKILKYFKVSGDAIKKVKLSKNKLENISLPNHKNGCEARLDMLDMIERYYSDANYFEKKGERVMAFGCLNYAHGWLDAGARLGFFDVSDATLFTVDDKK